MYILLCADGSYYTGSTNNLELRMVQHANGEGSVHTRKRLPVELIYVEEYGTVQEAFCREKQVQGWRRSKKEALINGAPELLPVLAIAYRDLRKGGLGVSGALGALGASGASRASRASATSATEGTSAIGGTEAGLANEVADAMEVDGVALKLDEL